MKEILEKPEPLLDFYVNFDCEPDRYCLVEKIVEIFCKIAKGIFLKREYIPMVKKENDLILRNLALEGLVIMIQNLDEFLKKNFVLINQAEINLMEETNEFKSFINERNLKINIKKGIDLFNDKPSVGFQHFFKLEYLNPKK